MIITSKNFDIKQIANSGQCFRMNPHPTKPNTFTLIAKEKYIELEQTPGEDTVGVYGVTENDWDAWHNYFDLSTDYSGIISSIDPADDYLKAAAEKGDGIRILRQDLWEVLVSFIISQNNNIPRIKKSIERLCSDCGTLKYTEDGQAYYCFPMPEQLLDSEKIKAAKLGYRERYIQLLAEGVLSGDINLEEIKNPDCANEWVEKKLKSICGVGTKVANCVMLFALHRLSSFPIDTWIKRVIDDHYDGVFPMERYQEYAGVIQQYMFYNAIS